MKKVIKEDLERLEELLRKASQYLEPTAHQDMLKSLLDKDAKTKLMERYPKCWLPVKTGQPAPLMIPICNRMGFEDPEVIKFSLKLVHKLTTKPGYEPGGELDIMKDKLNRLLSKFSGEIPKPANMACKKAKVTRMFNNIKKYLDTVVRTDG